jgi:hypothetical protein
MLPQNPRQWHHPSLGLRENCKKSKTIETLTTHFSVFAIVLYPVQNIQMIQMIQLQSLYVWKRTPPSLLRWENLFSGSILSNYRNLYTNIAL